MHVLSLLAVGLLLNALAVLFVICAVALILVVLVQKGRGGGLSAAFGGGAGGGLLGSKTGDFLTWVTIGLAGVFLLLAMVMAKFYKPSVSESPGAPPPVVQPQPPAPPPETPKRPIGELGAEGAETGLGGEVNLPG